MTPSVSLMPHAVCWAASPELVWTMVVTNAITFLSYVTICLTLLYMVRHTRRVIVREWAYFAVGFALFIVACGSTHALEVVTTWIPVFWIDALTNIVTAVFSGYVAIMLIRRAPVIAFGINDYAGRLANADQEKHELMESLLAAQKLQDWSRLSAGVSHEIRNPLESVRNLLYLIRTSEYSNPELQEYARLAEQETGRVLTISESALSFFREGREPEQVDLSEAMRSVSWILAGMINERRIRLEIDATGECTVEAFPGEARQVLLNLVRNACEATTRDGAEVSVRMVPRDSGVEVVVQDEGTGIDGAVLPTLFQFGKTTKGERGNGMGLWTVKHIVQKHGGDVTVVSSPGQGARFTLWWPKRFSRAHSGQFALPQSA